MVGISFLGMIWRSGVERRAESGDFDTRLEGMGETELSSFDQSRGK